MNNNQTKEKSQTNIHKDHRLRRKTSFLQSGLASFSDIEKLEFILFYAISQKDTNPIAHRLLDTFGSFRGVMEAPVEALAKIEGMGMHSAILINLIHQSFNAYSSSNNRTTINKVTEAKEYVSNALDGLAHEVFILICLNENGRILQTKTITSESSQKVDISIKTLTRTAINCNAAKVILGHNHPNGSPLPSDEDISFTSNFFLNCLLLDIKVVDHIITSPKGAFSFLHHKIMDSIKSTTIPKISGNKKALNSLNQPETIYINDEE
ncbi:MAG: DNA repair protein RadC [Clostridia bacterium]|nr:DNA repair protein RadC [Clostridia bacterium]